MSFTWIVNILSACKSLWNLFFSKKKSKKCKCKKHKNFGTELEITDITGKNTLLYTQDGTIKIFGLNQHKYLVLINNKAKASFKPLTKPTTGILVKSSITHSIKVKSFEIL